MVTTHNETAPGYGILADHETIYADSEDYYADGAVRMRDTIPSMRASSTEIAGTINYNVAGDIYPYESEDLKYAGNADILTGTIYCDASGATMFENFLFSTITTTTEEIGLLRAGNVVITAGNINYDASGAIMHHEEEAGTVTTLETEPLLLVGNVNILAGSIGYDASGAVMFDKETY